MLEKLSGNDDDTTYETSRQPKLSVISLFSYKFKKMNKSKLPELIIFTFSRETKASEE